MTSITICGLSVLGYIQLVTELKQAGFILDRDFTWAYARGDNNLNPLLASSCNFQFENGENATYFMLRWSHLVGNPNNE